MRHRWFTPVGLMDPDPVFGPESLGSYLGRYSGVVPRASGPLMGRRLGGLLDFGDFRGPQRERGASERRTLLERLGMVGEVLGGDVADALSLWKGLRGAVAVDPFTPDAPPSFQRLPLAGLAAAGLLAGPLMASGPVGRVLARKADDLPVEGMSAVTRGSRPLDEVGADLAGRHGLERMRLYRGNDATVRLDDLEVGREFRGQGRGTAAMNDLTRWADENGETLSLQVAERDARTGTTSRSRLVEFYKRHGFVENKGRNKDYAMSRYAEMYRRPAELPAPPITPNDVASPIPPRRVENPIRAYHGSPHDFDQFSMDAIGTGEGAQAYGHGLYFAESPDVAQQYRNFFAQRGSDWESPHNVAHNALVLADNNRSAAIESLERSARAQKLQMGATNPEVTDALALLRSGADLSPELPTAARMYEVAIHADPDEFLDWDAPLSQQPEGVRAALENAGVRPIGDPASTNAFTRRMAQVGAGSQADLSPEGVQALREAGIPGIRYYDQMSRGAGQGTRNYVVFDDSLVEILKKYGIAGVFGAGMLSRWANGDAR